MNGSRTIRQVAFAFAALLLPTTAFAVCDATTFTEFKNCMFLVPPGEGIRLMANIAPDASTVNVSTDRTVDNNGFGLTGGGPFIKSGAATLTLPTGNGGYSGAVHIQAGTIAVGAANSLGNGPLNVYGTGSLLALGSFSPLGNTAVAFQGGTPKIAAVNGATLRLLNVGSVGTTAVTLGDPINNGTLEFVLPSTVSLGTTMTLAGGNVRAPGVDASLALLVANGLTINSGAKLVTEGNSFTIADLQGAGEIATGIGSTVTINSGVYSGVISGFGSIAKSAVPGNLILLGANTYTGGTTVSAGVLGIGPGGKLGSGNLFIHGELLYNTTAPFDISQQMSGNGTLRVQAGTLTISGVANAFPGPTVIDGGTLSVTGTFNLSPITINLLGSLLGTGAVGNVTVNAGSIRPGLSPGALSMGSLTLAPAATLQFEVDSGTPGSGYDQIGASGSVSLSGAALAVVPGAYVPSAGESFVLISKASGGPIVGTFNGVPEGTATTMNGVPMFYTYLGGDGNDFALSVLTRTITPSVAANGTISPTTPTLVIHNTATTFTVTPNPGYVASVGGTCPGSLAGTTFTTGAITANCSVIPIFTPLTYTISSSGSNANGTITPASQPGTHDSTVQFTVTPSVGYTASLGGTCAAGSLVGTAYTTGVVTGACNVAATFTLNSYAVTSSGSNGNGSITPPTQPVNHGSTATFTVVQGAGYTASFGGTCPAGALVGSTYTTGAITAACNVTATFTLNSYTVTSSGSNANGTITPPSQSINHGSTAGFTVTPSVGYTVSFGGSCPTGALVGSTYTTGVIVGACNVTATFTLISYTVTSSAGANGTITPPTQGVNHGSTTTFTVTPSVGYTASMGGTCPAGSLVGTTYTTGVITAACNVAVTFTLNSYTVTSSAGANGTVTPPSQSVNHGSTTTFTVTPSVGYAAVVGGTCGGALAGTTYTTSAITGDCTVSATFTQVTYTVAPSAGANGTITPATPQTIAHGATTTFTVTPSTGYSAAVGGTCGGALVGTTYTTNVITADCTVAATFTQITYAVTPSAGTNGTITPSVPQTIAHGATTAFTVTPSFGYNAAVGGTCGGALVGTTYTTSAITASCTVAATFTLANPPRLGNISTRMQVLTGDDVMIGGFVIGGSVPKRVAIVATGPSLAAFGITNPLANPMITLVRSSDQATIGSSDDWQSAPNAADLTAAGFAPSNVLEAAILADLPPGAYTAIVQGAAGGTGVSVIGVYEVGGATIPLVNISTRGRVQTGDNVMIGGFIINGTGPQTLAIVATGPSLAAFGIASPLANPTLTVIRSSDQVIMATNDDWQADANASLLQAAGFAPSNPLESGIYITLPPGAYTAILSGVGGGTGVGVIGVYKVN